MVEVTIGGLKIKVDPAEHWQHLMEEDQEEMEMSIADDLHWMIVLHEVAVTQERKNEFWLAFREPDAARNRRKALKGLAWINYEEERDTLNHANWNHERRQAAIESGDEKACKDAWNAMALEGIKFAALIHKRDFKAFEKMAKILKEGKTPVSDSPRGGAYSEAGQMFREFVRLHLESRGLPTKKDLREACGLTGDPEKARKLMHELGLSGLPQAPL